MNNVFRELLGKTAMRQGGLEDVGEASKAAKPRENKPTVQGGCDVVRGSPVGKKGPQGRAVFGTRR